MITIEKTRHSKRNTLELQVLSLLGTAKFYSEDLAGFKRVFDEEIKTMKRPNTIIPELTYKCISPKTKVIGDPPCLEIWHVSPTGLYDRLIAKIINEE